MSEKASWSFPEGYEIAPGRLALEKLGGGKRYEVYLAWDEKLFSRVVVKVVRPDQIGDSKSVPDLEREHQTLARLAHPMLVRTFGLVTAGEHPHLVMEHFEGPTLRKLIKSYGPLPLEQLVPLAVQVCGALHYLSTEKVVHLDVKPSNIVMEAPPKLIDLSVARTHEAAAQLSNHVGTRKYMAPEQCDPRRLGPIAAPADVWGAGVTLYEAVSGRRPFDTPSKTEVASDAPLEARFPQVAQDPPPPLPNRVPRTVASLVLACLAKDPADRPTAAEVARSFEPLLEDIPTKPTLGRRRPKLR